MNCRDKIIFDAKVSERKILLVPIASIRHTPYNPPNRTKDGHAMKKLAETIRKHGLIYPLLITDDRNLIDGNRRLTACRSLGWEFVECIISPLDKDELFGDVNTNAMPLGGKGWLHVARGGGKLPEKESSLYKELHSLIGNYGIDKLIAKNVGLNILPLCKTVCSFGTSKRVEEVIMLCADGKLSNKLNAEIRASKTRAEKVAAMDAILEAT